MEQILLWFYCTVLRRTFGPDITLIDFIARCWGGHLGQILLWLTLLHGAEEDIWARYYFDWFYCTVLRRTFGPDITLIDFIARCWGGHLGLRGTGKRGLKKTTWHEVSCYVLLTKYYSGDQIKNIEIGRTRSTYGEEERFMQGFNGKTLGKETTWKIQA
jgi:hypothetical protein